MIRQSKSIHNCHLALLTYLNSTNRDDHYCHSRLVPGNVNTSYHYPFQTSLRFYHYRKHFRDIDMINDRSYILGAILKWLAPLRRSRSIHTRKRSLLRKSRILRVNDYQVNSSNFKLAHFEITAFYLVNTMNYQSNFPISSWRS